MKSLRVWFVLLVLALPAVPGASGAQSKPRRPSEPRSAMSARSEPDEPEEMEDLTRELWKFARGNGFDRAVRRATASAARFARQAPELRLPTGWVLAPAGARVRVGQATRGVRSYVAVAGGLAVDAVLGSRSTDTLAHVGPAVLRAGDVLPLGAPAGPPAGVDVGPVRRYLRPALLRVEPGPRDDWFHDSALTALTGSTYAVSGDSNRVGLRLEGPALERSREGELPSEGIVLGAVQVPASGQPLVFLNDHPTTGGYPVFAVVDPEDLWQCAQLRPGDGVRFTRR